MKAANPDEGARGRALAVGYKRLHVRRTWVSHLQVRLNGYQRVALRAEAERS